MSQPPAAQPTNFSPLVAALQIASFCLMVHEERGDELLDVALLPGLPLQNHHVVVVF